jgi:acyl-CoA synthetase (AMP-forming)/AMP-acid ligase II
MTRKLTSIRQTAPHDQHDTVFGSASPMLPEILALHGKWLGRKPAVICDGVTLTWRRFGEETSRVANGLVAIGLSRGDRIAIVMDNSIETIEALFGVMKAGCVSVPLNLSISDDAMAGMIIDAGARAIFASKSQQARLTAMASKTPAMAGMRFFTLGAGDEVWTAYGDWKAAQSIKLRGVDVRTDDVLNIIYSSGTTGRPKGIVHTHQTRLDWAYDLSIALRYHGGARTLCTLALYSNISWVMTLCTLLAGGTLIVSPKFDASAFIDDVEKHRVTHTALVPVQLRRILDHPAFSREKVASMQAMMSCGSPLHAELKRRIFGAFPCGVIELYGLTEGVITTLDPEDAEERMASVGKPLIGTDIKIIGDDDREAAAGAAGEIVSRGRIVMPGYLNRPDASREALWRDSDGRAWLRTGDIGRLDEEGFLYIVDRKKDMILSGGQNIYPADIEAVLLTHPAVKDAAVIGVPHDEWGEVPYAVIEARVGNASASEIADWLNARVGRRQRIAGIGIVEELPRNPNGKILKRDLRKTYAAGRPS